LRQLRAAAVLEQIGSAAATAISKGTNHRIRAPLFDPFAGNSAGFFSGAKAAKKCLFVFLCALAALREVSWLFAFPHVLPGSM
jgi:hypothetical protein